MNSCANVRTPMREAQPPVRTRFGSSVTAAEIARGVDLTGKFAIVTGGASGLGLETVKALAACGATICVPAIDPVEARVALDGVGQIDVWPLNLIDQVSVHQKLRRRISRTAKPT